MPRRRTVQVIRTTRRTLALLLWSVVAIGILAVGQEPILVFSLTDTQIEIPQGGEMVVGLRIENGSVYEAEGIEPFLEIEGLVVQAEPEEIESLPAFEDATIVFRLSASGETPLGAVSHVIEMLYTYCIGEQCFQFFEDIPLDLLIGPPATVPVELPDIVPTESSTQTLWIDLGVLGCGVLLLLVAVVIRRRMGLRWPLSAVLILFVLGGLTYGVFLNQHEQAQGIGAVLCTSCVGIEEAQHGMPELTSAGMEAISAIDQEIELLVFYAVWCHACPFAKAMVEAVATHNPRIAYRFVDVAQEPELAERSGVIQSGRTVVPAILRVDTGELIFGAEKLESRLIDLLEDGS